MAGRDIQWLCLWMCLLVGVASVADARRRDRQKPRFPLEAEAAYLKAHAKDGLPTVPTSSREQHVTQQLQQQILVAQQQINQQLLQLGEQRSEQEVVDPATQQPTKQQIREQQRQQQLIVKQQQQREVQRQREVQQQQREQQQQQQREQERARQQQQQQRQTQQGQQPGSGELELAEFDPAPITPSEPVRLPYIYRTGALYGTDLGSLLLHAKSSIIASLYLGLEVYFNFSEPRFAPLLNVFTLLNGPKFNDGRHPSPLLRSCSLSTLLQNLSLEQMCREMNVPGETVSYPSFDIIYFSFFLLLHHIVSFYIFLELFFFVPLLRLYTLLTT